MRPIVLGTIAILMIGLSVGSCGRGGPASASAASAPPAAGVVDPLPLRTVHVEILDEEGHALAAAPVRLIQFVDGATVETSRAVTDALGRAAVTAKPGPSRLDIEREPPRGLRPFSTPLVSEGDQQRVVLPRGGVLQGRFVMDGQPPTEAIRWSCCPPGGRVTTFVSTPGGGDFRMTGLDPGELVELAVAWPMAFVDTEGVERRLRERVTLTAPVDELKLEVARAPLIKGSLWSDGKPFVQWWHRRLSVTDALCSDTDPARANFPVRVDADGRFEVLLLRRPVEPVVLSVETTRFEFAEPRVLLSGPWDADRDLGAIDLPPARRIHFIIRGDDGVAPPPVDVSWAEILAFQADSVHVRKGRLLARAEASVVDGDIEICRTGRLTFEAEGFLPATLAVDSAIDSTVEVQLDRGASTELELTYVDGGRVDEPLVVSATTANGRRIAVADHGGPVRLQGFERGAQVRLSVDSPLAGAPLWERDVALSPGDVHRFRVPVSRPFDGLIEFRGPDGVRLPLDGTLFLAGPHDAPRSRIVGLIRDGRCEVSGLHEPSPPMEARFPTADAIPIAAGLILRGGRIVTVTVPAGGR